MDLNNYNYEKLKTKDGHSEEYLEAKELSEKYSLELSEKYSLELSEKYSLEQLKDRYLLFDLIEPKGSLDYICYIRDKGIVALAIQIKEQENKPNQDPELNEYNKVVKCLETEKRDLFSLKKQLRKTKLENIGFLRIMIDSCVESIKLLNTQINEYLKKWERERDYQFNVAAEEATRALSGVCACCYGSGNEWDERGSHPCPSCYGEGILKDKESLMYFYPDEYGYLLEPVTDAYNKPFLQTIYTLKNQDYLLKELNSHILKEHIEKTKLTKAFIDKDNNLCIKYKNNIEFIIPPKSRIYLTEQKRILYYIEENNYKNKFSFLNAEGIKNVSK